MNVPFLLSKHDDERARSDALLMARPLTEEEMSWALTTKPVDIV